MEGKNKQIPVGYKDSPLGVIPAEWEVKRLDEIAVKIQDGTHFSPTIYEDGDNLYITSKNVKNGYVDLTKRTYVKMEDHQNIYKRCDTKKGDILLTKDGTIGQACINPFDEEISLLSSVAFIRLDNCEFDNRYALQYILSADGQKEIEKVIAGQALKRITLHKIKSLEIKIPPLPEQQRIADVLGVWDQGIELQAKLVESLQKRKRALMQQLLTGKKRLKGFDQAWKKVKLGEIADMKSGGTPSSNNKSYYDGNIPWVVIADITKANKYIYRTEKLITQDGLTNSSAKILPINTVLYAMYASIGKTAISKVPLATNQAILGITPLKDKLLSEYLYYILDNIEGNVKLLGQSGTQSNLNKEMVKDFNFVIPSLPEQQAIAEILTAADREIELAQKKLEVLREQKRGLMQQLLTGKKRLKV